MLELFLRQRGIALTGAPPSASLDARPGAVEAGAGAAATATASRTLVIPARSSSGRLGGLLLELESAMGDGMLEKWWRTPPVMYGPQWRKETVQVCWREPSPLPPSLPVPRRTPCPPPLSVR